MNATEEQVKSGELGYIVHHHAVHQHNDITTLYSRSEPKQIRT